MSPIVPLNLPKTDLDISRSGDQLFVRCLVRKKKIVLTPEEWVRQHFIAYFLNDLSYPKGLLAVEKKIQYGAMEKRWDLATFIANQECFLLLECKAPSIPITKAVFEQSLTYFKGLQSRFLVLSNGIEHVIFKKEEDGLKIVNEFPDYPSFA
tara:strand:- start:908 stop:1363 length:456 start_codon:yes stop_codon:yes gene_type:complete